MNKMKRYRFIFLLIFVLALAGCGDGSGSHSKGGNGGSGEPVIPPSDNYLCFTANEDACSISTTITGSLTTTPSLEYSTDRIKWESFIINDTIVPLTNTGDKVYIRAKSSNVSFSENGGWISFEISGSVSASGNIMSLLEKYCRTLSVPSCAFWFLFDNNTTLTTAPELPATTLAEGCYADMFQYCTSLTTAPELPAKTLAKNCYFHMFNGCSTLTIAPELPATTLEERCYEHMFDHCTSLTTAPELPAKNLAEYCYTGMFDHCTSLTTAPELPATTLADGCYARMFNYCSNLINIIVYFTKWTDVSWNNATMEWLNEINEIGTFTCPHSLPEEYGTSRIPVDWTKIDL